MSNSDPAGVEKHAAASQPRIMTQRIADTILDDSLPRPEGVPPAAWAAMGPLTRNEVARNEAARLMTKFGPVADAPQPEIPKPTTARRRLLVKAANAIDGDRDNVYGGPERNFQRIADLWNALGYRVLSPVDEESFRMFRGHDVAMAMIQVKQARLVVSPGHEDSWLDTAGYSGCGWEANEGMLPA